MSSRLSIPPGGIDDPSAVQGSPIVLQARRARAPLTPRRACNRKQQGCFQAEKIIAPSGAASPPQINAAPPRSEARGNASDN